MAETVLNRQEPKLDPIKDVRAPNNRLKRTIGIVLSLVLAGLFIYVFNLQGQNSNVLFRSTNLALNAVEHTASNYRSYVRKYKETKAELEETTRKLEAVNRQLDDVTAQLTATKTMLVATQGLLAQAQEENAGLKHELQGLNSLSSAEGVQNVGGLRAKIEILKQKESQNASQLAELKNQLRVFQANFSNAGEGRSLIVLFQNKIKYVENHIRYLEQEAYSAKIAAQKEKDRLGLLNGNNGFIVHDGHYQTPGKKSFAIDVKIVQ